jgi:hypothetical protein
MLAWLCFSCLEYEFREKKETEQQGDGSEEDLQGNGGVDTAIEEDTPSDIGELEGQATAPMYLHTSSILYSWTPEGGMSAIGQFSLPGGQAPNITDLAIDLDGRMYAVSMEELFKVDASNAELEQVAGLAKPLVGLTFLSDGRLFGAGDGIFWVDPASGSMATLVEEGLYQTSGDIVGLPDGKMYWTVEGDGDDGLVSIDPVTAEADWIGSIGESDLWGVGYYDGILYGFSSQGRIAEIDPANADLLHSEETPGQMWWGAAANPSDWD